MYGLILEESSPFYGRADVVMKFSPIKLPYLQEALNLTEEQAITSNIKTIFCGIQHCRSEGN